MLVTSARSKTRVHTCSNTKITIRTKTELIVKLHKNNKGNTCNNSMQGNHKDNNNNNNLVNDLKVTLESTSTTVSDELDQHKRAIINAYKT